MNTTNLIHGDCIEVMRSIPDGSIDAIITDPPYGTTACKWDTVIDFNLMWKQLNRVIKKNGAIVLFGSEPFSSALRMSNIKYYRYDWIWHKNKSGNVFQYKNSPMKRHEIISVFSLTGISANSKQSYFPKMLKCSQSVKSYYNKSKDHMHGYNSTNRYTMTQTGYPESVIKFDIDGDRLHPTQKPVKLIEYLIKTYTNKNETVLDFTMGSGTTGIACHNLDRNFIGIELDKDYFKIASDRITEHKRQQKLF